MQVGFLGLLGLIFITLKLTGFIDWAWVWVLAPFWFSLSIIALVVIIGVVFSAVTGRAVKFYARKDK